MNGIRSAIVIWEVRSLKRDDIALIPQVRWLTRNCRPQAKVLIEPLASFPAVLIRNRARVALLCRLVQAWSVEERE